MAQEITVPQIGESITEATLAAWRINEGDAFNGGDILVELETDKITMELPAPESGTLTKIIRNTGETVPIGEIIASYEPGEGKNPSPEGLQESETTANRPLPPGAKRMAEEHNVDLSSVKGTGRGEQIRKEDIVHHLEKSSSASPALPPSISRSTDSGEREKIVPMTRLRQKIAERLVEAQQTAAILTTFNEVDLSNVMKIRSRYKESFKEKHGSSLGFMSFFTKASVEALKEFPAVNAEIRGMDLVYKNYYDIGVAVGGPRGLVVPVVRNADLLSFADIEKEIARLAGKVNDGSIGIEELQGGTFTISNGGVYGSLMSTPILNPPQSGILGMHSIQKRPVAVNDEVVIRPMMYIALSYDHRIVDGKEAVSFLLKVKQCIEDPERMLLDI
ncbi:MAG: 2-oxoglutarate dehydrogenase complex dihydrolipoyllysine-residue succinyltransferase [Spirochaetia bacterium]|nr:2-oxoglutarate dehydrogenase complex dihydrolipoyllysine-residue succinyltransferase [Spirochaetia bacterium]